MKRVRVAMSRSCQNRCRFCDVVDQLDRVPVPPQQVQAEIEAAARAGAEVVVLTGGEPTLSGPLLPAISFARARGLRVVLRTNGRLLSDPLKVGRLVAAGLHEVVVAIHGAREATHVALVGGDPVAHRQAVEALGLLSRHLACTVSTVLTATNEVELDALVALAASVGAGFELRALQPQGAALNAPELALSAERTWAARRRARAACTARGIPFHDGGFDGLGLLGARRTGEPVLPDDDELELIASRRPDPRLLAGLLTPPLTTLQSLAARLAVPLRALPYVLAATRTPLVDLPVAAGGLGQGGVAADTLAALPPTSPAAPLRGRVVVLVPPDADRWTAMSTLPALADALRAGGAEVTLVSPYRPPPEGDPLAAAPARLLARVGSFLRRDVDPRPAHPEDPSLDDAARSALPGSLLEQLAAHGSDTVVTWGWKGAALVRAISERARLVVIDPGTQAPIPALLRPGDRVRSPHPARAAELARAGIDVDQVRFAPLPLHLPHVPEARPQRSTVVLLAGPLPGPLPPALTALRLPGVEGPGAEVGPGAEAWRAAFAGARVLWVPAGARAPAQALAWAVATGLPVVAGECAETADHVRPDTGVLVHPARPEAARDALARADLPREGLARLREQVSVARLALALLHGDEGPRVVPFEGAGPWWSW